MNVGTDEIFLKLKFTISLEIVKNHNYAGIIGSSLSLVVIVIKMSLLKAEDPHITQPPLPPGGTNSLVSERVLIISNQ